MVAMDKPAVVRANGGVAVFFVNREQIEPANRAGWRRWLAEQGATSPGVWVVIHRKASGPQPLALEDAVEEALCVGWIDSTARHLDDRRSAVLFTPRRPKGTWSRTNKDRVARLAEQGLMTTAGQRAVERAQSNGSWSVLDDIDNVRVPPDLSVALATDPVAQAGFDAWTASDKKTSLWWIASARRPATRESRIAETVRRASKKGTGPGPKSSPST